ncbi:hypothetical protein JOQ06_014853, partial [Pogonophryne albipinna]
MCVEVKRWLAGKRRFALAPPPSSGPCSVLLSGAQVELSSKEQRLMVETKRKGRDDKKVMTAEFYLSASFSQHTSPLSRAAVAHAGTSTFPANSLPPTSQRGEIHQDPVSQPPTPLPLPPPTGPSQLCLFSLHSA